MSRDLAIFRPTRRLMSLPQSYSNLVSKASQFKYVMLFEIINPSKLVGGRVIYIVMS